MVFAPPLLPKSADWLSTTDGMPVVLTFPATMFGARLTLSVTDLPLTGPDEQPGVGLRRRPDSRSG